MAAHQAPPSLRFSRQEHWSGLPFPYPMHESEKWTEVAQSCPTLCNPMDCSPPGSSVHGIFQARILEWGATVLVGVKCSSIVALICNSLIINDVKPLITGLLAISIPSLEQRLFKSFAQVLIRLIVFLFLSYIFWVLNPYQTHNF